MSGSYFFVIVAHNDNPVYSIDFTSNSKEQKACIAIFGLIWTRIPIIYKI